MNKKALERNVTHAWWKRSKNLKLRLFFIFVTQLKTSLMAKPTILNPHITNCGHNMFRLFLDFLYNLFAPKGSLLSYEELVNLVKQGVINAPLENVNGSSIDLTLHNIIEVESCCGQEAIDLKNKESINTETLIITNCGYELRPKEFILASSNEIFNLPDNISAEYKLKSSMARNGLEHLNAGWADATWTNSRLTLELVNMTQYHPLLLKPGMKIGQVVFFRHRKVPAHAAYATRGQYNNQEEVTASKGIR
jgi:dCTP deaminase